MIHSRLTPFRGPALECEWHLIYAHRNAFRVKCIKWFTKSYLTNCENYSSKSSRWNKLIPTRVSPLYYIFSLVSWINDFYQSICTFFLFLYIVIPSILSSLTSTKVYLNIFHFPWSPYPQTGIRKLYYPLFLLHSVNIIQIELQFISSHTFSVMELFFIILKWKLSVAMTFSLSLTITNLAFKENGIIFIRNKVIISFLNYNILF